MIKYYYYIVSNANYLQNIYKNDPLSRQRAPYGRELWQIDGNVFDLKSLRCLHLVVLTSYPILDAQVLLQFARSHIHVSYSNENILITVTEYISPFFFITQGILK